MKKLIISVIAVSVIALGWAATARAENDTVKTSSEVIASDQSYTGLYTKVADRVEINGTVNGDVAVVASKFVLKGTVNGNVYVLAENARFEGVVTGNIHVLASDVELSSKATSAYILASQLTSTKTAQLTGSLAAAASEAEVNGSITQSAYVGASVVRYNAPTGGSVKLAASQITVGSDATIAGDLSYSQSAEIKIKNDKNIEGSIKQFGPPAKAEQPSWVAKASGALYGLIASFIIGAVMLWLAPRSVIATGDYVLQKPGQSLLAGFGFLVMAPIALLMIAVTLVGIPLAIIGLMVYITVLIVSHIFVALLVGRRALGTAKSKKGNGAGQNLLPLLLGLLITGVLELLPVLGGLFTFAILIAGIGALVSRNWLRLRHVASTQRAA